MPQQKLVHIAFKLGQTCQQLRPCPSLVLVRPLDIRLRIPGMQATSFSQESGLHDVSIARLGKWVEGRHWGRC